MRTTATMRAAPCGPLVIAVVLALAFVPAACAVQELDYRESFPNALLPAHSFLIFIPVGLTFAAICAAAVVACARTLRMTVLLVLGVWLALVGVGVVSWSVTYVASRDVILERAETIVSATVQQASATVLHELEDGLDMMQLLQFLATSGSIQLSNVTWPEPQQIIDRLLSTVGRDTTSVFFVGFGTREGRLHGIGPGSQGMPDTHYVLPLPGDYLPQWARCEAADWGANCSQIATPSACADPSSEAAVHCAKSCGFPQNATRNCVGRLSLFTANLANRPTNTSAAVRDSIFEEPAGGASVSALEFDPRLRPWYTRNEAPTWSSPYLFSTGDTGISLSAGVVSQTNEHLGSVLVDFTLAKMTTVMRDVKPSDNGLAFLITTDSAFVGSSMSREELALDTHVTDFSQEESMYISNFNNSASKITHALKPVWSKWGTLEAAAVGSSMYQYDSDMVVSYPIKLPGLTMLLVVSMPLSDIMGKADRASTLSLVMTVSISVGLALLAAVGLKVALLPLEKLRQNMYDVACMNVEGHEDGVSSHLTEIRSMQESFSTMVKNLIEYKQYLPQSVLRLETESDTCDGSIAKSKTPGSLTSKDSSGTRTAQRSFQDPLTMQDQLLAAPRVRSVSVLVTNLKGFVGLAKSKHVRTVTSLHAHYLETVAAAVNGHRGIIDEFIGDKVHASFNTVFTSSIHRTHATECMLQLKTHLLTHEDHKPLEVNAAAVSMKALCGNMGCKGLKKYTIVGAAGRNVWTFERWGRAWGVPLVVDANIARDTEASFDLYKLVKVRIAQRTDAFIFELVGPKSLGTEEWMYQLDTNQGDPIRLYNDVVEGLYEGQFEDALSVITSDKSRHELLWQWVRQCKTSGTVPQALPVAWVPERAHTRPFCDADYAHVPAVAVPPAASS